MAIVFALFALLLQGACSPVALVASVDLPVRQASVPFGGRVMYVRDGDLWFWQDGASRQLTSGGTWRQPAYSPDGREIAYVYDGGNFSDIWLMSADGSTSRKLTSNQTRIVEDNVWAMRPTWSRDGSKLAYTSDANSLFPTLWMMNKDGGGKRQLSAGVGVEGVDSVSWSPDGNRLAVTGVTAQPSQIYIVDVAKGGGERLTSHPQGAFDPAWSPDGGWMAYIGRESRRGELWVRDIDGNVSGRLDKLAFIRSPAWSPDGKHLAVLAAQSGEFEVWVIPVTTGQGQVTFGDPVQLTDQKLVHAGSGITWTR
ncbi:MAG: hypothetical protein U0821_02640 [Chloroflexota bacterium]